MLVDDRQTLYIKCSFAAYDLGCQTQVGIDDHAFLHHFDSVDSGLVLTGGVLEQNELDLSYFFITFRDTGRGLADGRS